MTRGLRWRGIVLGASAVTLVLSAVASPDGARAAALSISISGNRFVNASGRTVQLVGVDRESSEYACTYGYVASGPGATAEDPSGVDPLDAEDAAAIAAWHANAVRLPLNEDCWLGINGLPAGALSAQDYRTAIEDYVSDLGADGIYTILDLHWSAPGGEAAEGQHAMPDAHALAFWSSLASAFREDPAVLFDAFNEPYSPEADGWSGYPVSWSCWREGGCAVPDAVDGTPPSADPSTYTAVGMQQLVDAIRATGAEQPIVLGGLTYANNLSGWLANEPTDPLPVPQLAASFHNYEGEACQTEACWEDTIAPLAEHVPVVTGEFDQEQCAGSEVEGTSGFDEDYMSWADRHGVSYLAWGWLVPEPTLACNALSLIGDYSGTPSRPNGVAVHAQLAVLAAEAQRKEAEEDSAGTNLGEQSTGNGEPRAHVGTQPPSGGAPAPSASAGATGTATPADVPPSVSAASTIAAALDEALRTRAPLTVAGVLAADGWRLRFRATNAGLLTVRCMTSAAASRGAALVALASRSLARGAVTLIQLRLTRAGRRLLRSARTLRLLVEVSFAANDRPLRRRRASLTISG